MILPKASHDCEVGREYIWSGKKCDSIRYYKNLGCYPTGQSPIAWYICQATPLKIPPSQSSAGDWFALGQIFTDPFWFEQPTGGDPSYTSHGAGVGIQVLAAMDAGTQKFLHAAPIPKTPSYFTASEIVAFLQATFARAGRMPRVGILLSPSVWQSSQEMLLNEETDARAEMLQNLDVEIAPMPQAEKDRIVEYLRTLNLGVAFEDE